MLRVKWWLTLLAGVGLLVIGIIIGSNWFRNQTSTNSTTTPQSATQLANDPFMGVADQSLPYDQRFIDEMVLHHQGAIMSAEMMIGTSKRPELQDLSRRIQQSQQRQIDQMLAWRKQWYGDTATTIGTIDPMAEMMANQATPGAGGMTGNGSMMGNNGNQNMMGGMMGNQDQDRMFLKMMIPHHQLAIDMAKDALQNAQHPEIKELARQIITDQTAEISEMEGYLRTWYNETSTRDSAPAMRDMMKRMMGR